MPSVPHTWTDTECDRFAWQAVCGWPAHSGIEVEHEGLDYGVLTRCFLWDKVPRAVRHQLDPEKFEFEQALLAQTQPCCVQPTESQSSLIQRLRKSTGRFARLTYTRLRNYGCDVVLVPRQHPQLRSTIRTFSSSASSVRLIAPFYPGNTGMRMVHILPKKSPFLNYAQQLHEGIVRGLKKGYSISILDSDQQRLQQQILELVKLIRQVEAELAVIKPQAILVFADNHMPLQVYVAIANREGIPTIMLQHGLDCELYCLDDAYASVVAVWGEARKQRYEKNSEQRPTLIQVTGNPRYDDLRLPEQLCPGGDRWLWVTRPHGPEKCLLPSRSPKEGLDILAAILAALKQNESAHLTIKPHPFDYSNLYLLEIEKWGMGDRVTITREPLDDLMPQFDVVISEDSTAAMEAMFYGKIVVHAHFAASPPALPLVDYAAALPANNSERLQASLREIKELTSPQKDRLFQGQRNFIRDYVGPLDGKASQRVSALIHQTIARKH